VIPSFRPWPLVLSARSEASLRTSAANLSAWVKEHANANGSSPVLPDLTYTLGARRNHHPHRLTLVADSWAELAEELDSFAKKEESQKIRAAFTARREQAPRIGFILSGQGPAMVGNGSRVDEA
jgi:Polyketide synthase modules and related proteins